MSQPMEFNRGGYSMRLRALCVSCILLILTVQGARAQRHLFRYKLYTNLDGLSQNSITCMLQDQRGFMWFGTQDGLNRFDGISFRAFKTVENQPYSISNNYIQSIIEDRNGDLWIGTQGGGLNRYSRMDERFMRITPDMSGLDPIAHSMVFALLQDRSGFIWIGFNGGGLDRYNPHTHEMVHFHHDPRNEASISDNHVTSLAMDNDGRIWVGTRAGINSIDPESGQILRYDARSKHPLRFRDTRITTLCSDTSNTLWIGTENGLYSMDPKTMETSRIEYSNPEFGNLSSSRITYLKQSNRNTLVIWIGVWGKGILRYDVDSRRFMVMKRDPRNPQSLSDDEVYSICEDRSGGLWVGTGYGLNCINRDTKSFVTLQHRSGHTNSLSHNTVWSIFEDKEGALWIGTAQGLNRFDRSTGNFKQWYADPNDPGSLSHNSIFSLLQDHAGRIWIGTERGGLNSYNPDGTFTRYPYGAGENVLNDETVTTLVEDRNGNLWIGTGSHGLSRLDQATGKYRVYRHWQDNPNSIGSDRVYSALVDRDGILWIGTWGGGVNRYDPSTDTFKRYQNDPDNPESLVDNNILCIFESENTPEEILYIGTSNGLSMMNKKTGSCIHLTERDGLPNNVIYGILEDENGLLWMSTNQGLVKWDRARSVMRVYDVFDGLQSNEFNRNAFCKCVDGAMVFGGIGGFSYYYPRMIIDNPFVPPVVITDLKIFNQSVPVGEWERGITILNRSITESSTIRIPHQVNMITLEFAALHFAAPEKNHYAVFLEGLDRSWNRLGTRGYVTYTNLPPRTYTFRVKASNNDGIWNEIGASLRIVVPPPFWNTWWFRTLALLACAGVIVTVHQIRIRNIRQRNEQLEEMNRRLNDQIVIRETSERQLRDERNILQTIMDNIPDLIYYKDRKSRFIRINKSQAKWMGFQKPEDADGHSDFDFYAPEIARVFYNEEQQIIKTGKPLLEKVEEQPAKDGTVSWVASTTKVPLLNSKGKVVGIIGVSRDITKLIEAEKVLKEAQERLEKQVHERTLELRKTNQELKEEIEERRRIEAEREKLIEELQEALKKVKTLRGMLPICASCKKVRDDQGYWKQVEEYFRDHSDVEFSHGLCPDCLARIYPEYSTDEPEDKDSMMESSEAAKQRKNKAKN